MGKRGRSPKPTSIKLLEGNPGKRSLKSDEPSVPVLPDVPKPPSWLFPDAKRHWKQEAPVLVASGVMSSIDRDAFAAYCNSYAKWVDLQRQMASKGFKWLVPDRFGVPRMNPLVIASKDAQEELLKWAREFGMTPSARSRVSAVGGEEEDDEFDQIIKSKGGASA